jgi:hypothetical protein
VTITLVPFTEAHITPEYVGWLNDRHLMRHSPHRLIDHAAADGHNYLATFKDTPNHFWAVLADGRMVGTMTCRYSGYSAELGILIGVPGKGYGREAWGQAMYQSGASRITAGTSRSNTAMLRIFAHYLMRLVSVNEDSVRVELVLA